MASGFIKGPYPSRPLVSEECEIRLLVMLPGRKASDIVCDLLVARLPVGQTPPPRRYHALSYCWGTRLASQSITINSSPFYPTQNLHDALSALREAEQSDALQHGREAQPILLWIDAVCINQQDNAEKSHQIQKMRDIYQLASSTYIWLGQGEGECEAALRMTLSLALFAQEILRNASNCNNLDGRPRREKLKHGCRSMVSYLQRLPPIGLDIRESHLDWEAGQLLGTTKRTRRGNAPDDTKAATDPSLSLDRPAELPEPTAQALDQAIRRAVQLLSSPEGMEIVLDKRNELFGFAWDYFLGESGDQRSVAAFHKLLRLSWFTRIWVVQEVAVSNNPVLLYGCPPCAVPWDTFICAVTLVECVGLWKGVQLTSGPLFTNTVFSFDEQREAAMSEATDPTTPLAQACVEAAAQTGDDFLRAEAFSRPKNRRSQSPSSSQGNRVDNLLSVMRRFRPLSSTMPQDKIFALQGLIYAVITPDYADSMAYTYAKFAFQVMSDTGSVAILEDACTLKNTPAYLPTWVPDWSDSSFNLSYISRIHHRAANTPHLVSSRLAQEDITFDCAGGVSCHPVLSIDGCSLKLSGVLVDCLKEVARTRGLCPPRYYLWWPLREFLSLLSGIDFDLEERKNSVSTALRTRSKFIHTMEFLTTYFNIGAWRHRTYPTGEPMLIALQRTLYATPPFPGATQDRDVYFSLATDTLLCMAASVFMRPFRLRNQYIAAVCVILGFAATVILTFFMLLTLFFVIVLSHSLKESLHLLLWAASCITLGKWTPWDIYGPKICHWTVTRGPAALCMRYLFQGIRSWEDRRASLRNTRLVGFDIHDVQGQNVIARTDQKLLCLVPRIAAPGDFIVIFEGGQLPFVIRREVSGLQEWKMVGRCYVHGIMHGSAFDESLCQEITLV